MIDDNLQQRIRTIKIQAEEMRHVRLVVEQILTSDVIFAQERIRQSWSAV